MISDIRPNMTSTQRAAFMQAERVHRLRAEVEAAEARVSKGQSKGGVSRMDNLNCFYELPKKPEAVQRALDC